MGLSVSILGASGYAGGELLRLLQGHPALSVVGAGAHSQADAPIHAVHPHLQAADVSAFQPLDAVVGMPVDVCFSALPAGSLSDWIDRIEARVIVDLADDHRASAGWTYGLTEHCRAEVGSATRIANPGCYPTATLLGILPFAKAGLVHGPLCVAALSGISGAGKGLDDSFAFSALHGSASAYGSTNHRHVPEMERGLELFADRALVVSFTPHLVPMARGLLVTIRAPLSGAADDVSVLEVLQDTYGDEPFITVTPDWPSTKSVLGTNRAVVSARVDQRAELLVVSTAIDNLGKGAAGQAIQNANLALGVEEAAGLDAVAVWP